MPARMHQLMLRKLHSFTGLVPLGAYMGFHTWEHWPVRDGRDAALHRMALASSAPVEIVLLMMPLLVHATLGLRLARGEDNSGSYYSPAFCSMQRVTGMLLAPFLLWHVGLVWLPRVIDGGRAEAAYSAMRDQAGPVAGMILYVLGISAVCVHFGQGLGAAWIRHGNAVSVPFARWVSALLGLALWIAMIDVLSVYATGAALL